MKEDKMTKRNHWLYGKDKRKFQIDVESDCDKCIHLNLCCAVRAYNSFETICLNYNFGTSQYEGCGSCSHRFTRWDKEKIPCFICKFFGEIK